MAYSYTINLNTLVDVHEIYKVINNTNQLNYQWIIFMSSKQFNNSLGFNIKNNSTIINCRMFNNRLSLISSKEFDFDIVVKMLLDKLKIFKSDINNIEAKYIFFNMKEKKYNNIILAVPVL
ncbi:hypothetical protein QJ854_gp183 [Moumouvirus goulette]|uniref:Uncharacterized protein n=1 Tax=Moumouvirus goulette TaxID=1247379 RepID=M1PCA8_9VIRU|nr:hypothetical protein QJ854_gp183 [Moumouvirus goulette]AGF85599.1 hypothetical protein glt_00794 [Moumouvirus goulette]